MSMKPPLSDLPIVTADSGFYRGFSVNVTVVSKIIISMLVVWCIVWPTEAGTVLGEWNTAILAQFAAWYIWVVAAFVIVCIGLSIWPAAGRLNVAGQTHELGACGTHRARVVGIGSDALLGKGLAAVRDDPRYVRQGLDVVDHGRSAEQPVRCRE